MGSRALLKAEERTSSIIEGVRSTQAGVARGVLRVLDSEERPKLRSVAKFLVFIKQLLKAHSEINTQNLHPRLRARYVRRKATRLRLIQSKLVPMLRKQ